MHLSLVNRSLLHDLFDRQFGLTDSRDSYLDSHAGRYRVSSDSDNHSIQISLPGHDKESVKISIEDSRLLIKAEASEEISQFAKSESFRFKLPKDCNPKEIDAKMKNGILTVSIAKIVEKPESKRIEIAID